MALGPGKSVQLIAVPSGLIALVAQDRSGGDQDLYGIRLSTPELHIVARERVNELPGSARATGEGGPVLAGDRGASAIYAIWNQDDPRHLFANRLRCSRYDRAAHRWLPSVLINDDRAPSTHSFPAAAVGLDGSLYVAWIDRRHNALAGAADYPGGGDRTHDPEPGASLYVAVSRDGGRTFTKNRYVSGSVCGCCRVALAVIGQTVVAAWRGIDAGDIRDITVAASPDGGGTWTKPHVAVRDGWKINGCPHVGPTLAVVGDELHLAWLTAAGGEARIQWAVSKDGSRTFSAPVKLSNGAHRVNGPHFLEADGSAQLVFHGFDGAGRATLFGLSPPRDFSPKPLVTEAQESIAYPVAAGEYVAWLAGKEAGTEVRLAKKK